MTNQEQVELKLEGSSEQLNMEAVEPSIEQQLQDELNVLNARAEQFKQQQEQFELEQQLLEKQKQELQLKTLENQSLAADLASRQLQIDQREAEVKAEFANYKLTELDRLKEELEQSLNLKRKDIEKKKEALVKEFDHKREELEKSYLLVEKDFVKHKQQIEQELSTFRETRLKDLEKEYNAEYRLVQKRLQDYRADMETIINEKQELVNQSLSELQQDRRTFEQDRQYLQKTEEELRRKELELASREKDLRMEQQLLKSDREVLEERVAREIQVQLQEKDAEVEQVRVSHRRLMERVNAMQQELDRRDASLMRLGNRTMDDLLREIDEAKKEITNLRQELSVRPDQQVVSLLEEKSRRYDDLHKEFLELSRKAQAIELAEHRAEMSVAQLHMERQKYEVELKRREAIELQIQKYEEEVKRLKAIHEQPEEIKARRGVIEEAYFDIKPMYKHDIILDEMKWLEFIIEACERSGMKFNKRLFYAFHTALKTSEYSPLTVLAGVSGTGKSELPRLYTRFGGLYYLPLPVQPDWDSPQSLFGYFNSVDNRFNATPLIRSMVQFQGETNERTEATSLKDGVLLVLLDEMNLAHVELYFSELLSKLELRRANPDPVHVDIDLGAGMDKLKVELSRNVLWVGTMNEDETTKSLSDKVIDRGNLISFPRPTTFEDRQNKMLLAESKKLPRAVWDGWLSQQVQLNEEIIKYKEALEEINSYLEVVGRALGHRVWQSVKNYIGHHPLVIVAKRQQDEATLADAIQGAFEEALVHKVMPKLRGIEVEGTAYTQCLSPIKEKLIDVAGGLVHDFELAISNAYGVFIWRSAKYLDNDLQQDVEQALNTTASEQ